MIEHIDLDLCDGCNVCIESCPTDVIRLVEDGYPWEVKGWKVVVAYPNECHSCRLCAIDCHVDAITVTHELHIPAPFLDYQRT
ncbi:ferredoxin family protein [Cycloclasticus sp. P1]|jgi:NAD-dependent dihydropyrimidine dehydrogenase PreA subunit|uniref:4Fe-4S dicluster domain-containing protein n=1 Tax=Cycloclasticus sp. (strain P1) TaxID=385025 RepID=UPI000286ACAA|nr:4Fe-4S binding protein [Cycloclasticus sp. P1]AFT66911.1 4Fe-4S ferredoxin, iron-sulfur binding domain protein [Cycloclasticus sp. P1]KXJ48220.1 MAG: 4Fe-4S ferredoxin [Cycloclasticus sp. Phe_18]MBV1928526.1 4Fe-4S binding protein [Gammaproteobacteria bacterium]